MVHKRKFVFTNVRRKKKGRGRRSMKVSARPRARRSLPLTGFGKCKMVRLRYVQTVSLDAGAGLIAFNVFTANDLRDPDFTGAILGHQPRGFDQNMESYNHFTVLGAKCQATYLPTTASTNPGIMGILLTGSGSAVSTFTGVDDMLETKAMGKNHVVCGGINRVERHVFKNFSAKKFFCATAIVGKDLYRGNTSASPQEKAFFEVIFSSTDSNDPTLAKIRVTIDYIAMLTEPKIIGLS